MKIENVDFFYLSMPVVTDEGDGSQDALLVRLNSGGLTGWGECEASALVSFAAFVCPMSHGACQPVRTCVLGQEIINPGDISRIAAEVDPKCMDLLLAAQTFSGVEIAMWDLAPSASLQPYAGLADHRICEYPFAPKPVAWDMNHTHLLPDSNGEIAIPGAPGLGIEFDLQGVAKYVVDTEISYKGQCLYKTPKL